MVKFSRVITVPSAGDVFLPSNGRHAAQSAVAAARLAEMKEKIKKALRARAENDKRRDDEEKLRAEEVRKYLENNTPPPPPELPPMPQWKDQGSQTDLKVDDPAQTVLQLRNSLQRIQNQELTAELSRARAQIMGLMGRVYALEQENENLGRDRVYSIES